MTSPHKNRHYTRFTRLLVAAVAACTLVAVRSAPAADLAEQAHSLRQVPADAAFYSASLRFKEQWHTFADSKAYGKLMEIPFIQLIKMGATFQWQQANQPVVARVREYVESPAGQDAVNLVHEMFSDEIYAYGSSNIAETLKTLMEANSIARSARLEAIAAGEDPGKAVTEKMLQRFKEQLGKGITVPTLTIGFRIKDKDRAKRELDEIHSLLRGVLDEHQPDLAAHLQREQIGGHEFLTFRLDGSMIPWEQIREQAHDLDDDQFNEIKDAVSKQTIAIALGVEDEFVLLSIGATTDHLEKIGQGPTLADQAALKPIEQHAKERVVAISYISKAFMESLGSPQKTVDDIAGGIEEALVQAKVDEEDRKTILDDIRALDLAKYMPAPGDATAIAFLTARGYEAYQYTHAARPMMDSSKPLSILSHVGGTPLFMIASHSKSGLDDYVKFADWLKRVAGHAEAIAEKKADSDDWDKYQKIREKGIELLERLDEANREKMIPALADGQGALVIDFTAKSQQWFEKMPPAAKPLPMLELAFVASVSDSDKLREGLKTYVEVGKEAYKLAKEVHEDDMPELKLPKPVISDLDGGGKLYTYPLPKKWGIDPQVAINAGLTSSFGAVSLMPLTTERLLKDKPLEIDTSLKLDRPAALVTHVEFAKMIEAVRPWINYGLDIATGKIKPHKGKEAEDDSDDSDAKPPAAPTPAMIQMGMFVPQMQQVLDVASALKSATSMSYEENGLWVTHSETHIEDLK
ncbi:MAG TPA: hypothetical protein VH107_03845 [Lacipirellulaceae bacterium]|jgi:hypothetical protein|nr:hypothetical protein [Lacipirellulaceae bacterium]